MKARLGELTSHFLYLTSFCRTKQETKPAFFCNKTGRMQPNYQNTGICYGIRLQMEKDAGILVTLFQGVSENKEIDDLFDFSGTPWQNNGKKMEEAHVS